MKLLRFLVMNNYKPETIYSWMLLADCPDELREEYRQGNLSYKNILRQRRGEAHVGSQKMLIDEINWSYECFFADEGGLQ